MKIIILGHARHGKDTVAALLAHKYDLSVAGTSHEINKKIVYPMLKNFYSSPAECYTDRVNNRELWYKLVREYCADDKARLCKEIFTDYDIYIGMRDAQEFEESMEQLPGVIVIWVDAMERVGTAETGSFNIIETDDMIHIDNNGSTDDLINTIERLDIYR